MTAASLVSLACGHVARAGSVLRPGAWITCTAGRCQGQRRVTAVQPAPAPAAVVYEQDALFDDIEAV